MARGQNVRIVEGSVGLTGSNVDVGGTSFRLGGDGQTLYGASADRPTAAAAHAAVPFAYYVSVDTQAVEQSDGSNWVAV